MSKTHYPYLLFFTLLVTGILTTFFVANIFSVTTHTDQTDMVSTFPIVLELDNNVLQVVTPEQLMKLQLPDPETQQKMVPQFLLSKEFFIDHIMAAQTIIGKSITNGNIIHIPTNYSAQVQGRQINKTTQEISIIFGTKAEEDYLITVTYIVQDGQYTPQTQTIKNILIWKTIFMNGMMFSVILPFLLCQWLMKKKRQKVEPAP